MYLYFYKPLTDSTAILIILVLRRLERVGKTVVGRKLVIVRRGERRIPIPIPTMIVIPVKKLL
jgi:hypothetical protein